LTITAVIQLPSLDHNDVCQWEFFVQIVGFLVIWSSAILIEVALIIVSLRGTILGDELRWHSEYLLYIKLGETLVLATNNIYFILLDGKFNLTRTRGPTGNN
jgi:hypothetical protein